MYFMNFGTTFSKKSKDYDKLKTTLDNKILYLMIAARW